MHSPSFSPKQMSSFAQYLFLLICDIIRSYYSVSRQMIASGSSTQIKIYIRLYNGNGCPLTVQPDIIFNQLIKLINKMQLQLPEQYTIVFKGRHVKNYELTLYELGICENSILHIEEAVKRSLRSIHMDVCVCFNQQIFIVKSSASQTVLMLKQTIYKLTKISPRHQILVFNGNKLDNQNTLQSYIIFPNSLICLISTMKVPQQSQVHSDYDQVINNFLKPEEVLLDSALSLFEKKESTKIKLFRSDSINRKHLVLCSPIQVEIRQQSVNEENESQSQIKDFNFDLFKAFGISNPMALSISYNLFESIKHPLELHTFQLKDEDLMEQNDIFGEGLDLDLASSVKSFKI